MDPMEEIIGQFHKEDGILQLIVNMANDSDFEMSITLFIKGTIISGKLIGFNSYIREIVGQFRSLPTTTDIAKQNANTIASVLEGFCEESSEEGESSDEGEELIDLPEMIHLKEINILSETGSSLSIGGAFWRGRIDSVDGFIFGSQERSGMQS
jgi:hypothetical protein